MEPHNDGDDMPDNVRADFINGVRDKSTKAGRGRKMNVRPASRPRKFLK